MIAVLLISTGIIFQKAGFGNTLRLPQLPVRLINSFLNSSREGRLEIYYNDTWGTVCDDDFTNVSARVACASLGFGFIGTVIGNRHGAGTGQIWLDDVICAGMECGIDRCTHRGWGMHNCGHSEDVSISCGCEDRHFFLPTGTISSPNYPNTYYNNLDCYTYISVSSGHTVIIRFEAFNAQPSYDWLTITCASGKPFTSPRYSGSHIPAALTISSCNRVNVSFHTDGFATNTNFRLEYNIISGNTLGGFTTKPSNAFPRSDKNDPIIFNCTTATHYPPWWTMNAKGSSNYTITNSTCGIITSASYSSWFRTETLGSGSCNLIVVAPANRHFLLAGTFVCTDSTMASARAIIAPINLELGLSAGMNSLSIVTDIIRDEEIRLSCNSSFAGWNSDSSPVFTYFLYNGGPVVQMRILRTYWTSEGSVVSSTDASIASSYVLVKAAKGGVIPRYTCNIVFDFHSNISDITANSTIEVSFCTDPINVEGLYNTYQNLKLQILILGALAGVAVLIMTIVLVILLSRKCRQLKVKTAAAVGHKCDGNDYELQQRKGEDNFYSNEIGKAVDIDESEYGNLDTSKRRFEAAQEVYQALQLKK